MGIGSSTGRTLGQVERRCSRIVCRCSASPATTSTGSLNCRGVSTSESSPGWPNGRGSRMVDLRVLHRRRDLPEPVHAGRRAVRARGGRLPRPLGRCPSGAAAYVDLSPSSRHARRVRRNLRRAQARCSEEARLQHLSGGPNHHLRDHHQGAQPLDRHARHGRSLLAPRRGRRAHRPDGRGDARDHRLPVRAAHGNRRIRPVPALMKADGRPAAPGSSSSRTSDPAADGHARGREGGPGRGRRLPAVAGRGECSEPPSVSATLNV